MGQTLSEPVVEKHTTEGGDKRIMWAATEMQAMEDAHTTINQLSTDDTKHISFFAVYDGHGGTHAAKYSGQNLHGNVAASPDFEKGEYKKALKYGFLKTDENLRKDPQHEKEPSGCTAVATLVTEENTIYCANAGDSRAVLSNKGTAIPLSFDHKPVNQGEYNRICNAGGFVEFGRVNGNLALSRAIGDFEFKNNINLPPEDQIVTCDPDITERVHTEGDEFFVVACDGIWDCLTSQQVIDFVSTRIVEGQKLTSICEALTDRCLATDSMSGLGCDNMTVIICALLGGKSEEEWRESVKGRYQLSTPGAFPVDGVN